MNSQFKIFLAFFFTIITFSNIGNVSGSLKFELQVDKPKCYIEELFKGSVLMAKWKISNLNEPNEEEKRAFLSHIQVYISNNDGDILKREIVHSEKGKISYHSDQEGFYKVCVSYHGGWSIKYPILMGIKLSSDNMDEPNLMDVIKNKDLDPLHQKTKEILDHGKKVIDVQEAELRTEDWAATLQIQYSKNYYYVTILQIVVVVGLGLYQVFNFRKFLVMNDVI